MRFCLLAALLVAAVLAGETVIYESDPTTCTVKEEGKDLPKVPKIAVPSAPKTKQAMPADASYLKTNPVGGNSKWIYSTDKASAPAIFPIGTWLSFSSKIYTDCPQKPATLWVSAWGWNYYVIYLNGNYVADGWGWNGLQSFSLNLNCGCNDLVIYVYSYCACSAGICFNVKQDTTDCYACKNEGVTFYNRDTCQCECVSKCTSCSYPLQSWFDYPTCSCMCSPKLEKVCSPNQYYNKQTCECQCSKVCCKPGFVQDPKSCKCVKDLVICTADLCWNGKPRNPLNCECPPRICTKTICALPATWSSTDCACV